MDAKHLLFKVICCYNAHGAFLGEFEGILHQVDEDLLQAQLVTSEPDWKLLRLHQLFLMPVSRGRLEAFYCHSLVAERAVLHLRLGSEHCFDEFEGIRRLEAFDLFLKLFHFDQFQVEHVVDKAEQEVELRDDQVKHLLG